MHPSDPSILPLTVVVDGAFGAAVADQLARLVSLERIDVGPGGVDHSALRPGAAIVLATARPDSRVELGLNTAARCWNTRFVPVVREANLLRVGPVVDRGSSGCARCLRTRTRQHARSLQLLDALDAFHTAPPRPELAGHLPAHTRLAAGLALTALHRPVEPGGAGIVSYVDLVGSVLRRVPVTGVHACPDCGLGRDERDRTISRLRPAVAALVGAGSR